MIILGRTVGADNNFHFTPVMACYSVLVRSRIAQARIEIHSQEELKTYNANTPCMNQFASFDNKG